MASRGWKELIVNFNIIMHCLIEITYFISRCTQGTFLRNAPPLPSKISSHIIQFENLLILRHPVSEA